jgi:hypothetical protein
VDTFVDIVEAVVDSSDGLSDSAVLDLLFFEEFGVVFGIVFGVVVPDD